MAPRRFHFNIRNTAKGVRSHTIAFGFRIGYWPCLVGPYFEVSFYRWHVALWYGLPSYREMQ